MSCDYRGLENNGSVDLNRRQAKDVIRAVHLKLVEDRIRDEVPYFLRRNSHGRACTQGNDLRRGFNSNRFAVAYCDWCKVV